MGDVQKQLIPGHLKRPDINDPAILAETADKLADEVFQWLVECSPAGHPPDDADREGVGREVQAVLGGGLWDGYHLARDLEGDFGYEADTRLCEILDQAETYRYFAHEKLTKKWVAENEVKPKLPAWGAVTIEEDGQRLMGKIVHIDRAQAQYTVCVPSLGHVESGRHGTLGICLPFEDVEAINPKGDAADGSH